MFTCALSYAAILTWPVRGRQVLSGDFHQLPPVAKGAAAAGRRFAFEAAAWRRCVDASFQLTTVYRQVWPPIIMSPVLCRHRAKHILPRPVCKPSFPCEALTHAAEARRTAANAVSQQARPLHFDGLDLDVVYANASLISARRDPCMKFSLYLAPP